MHLNTLPTQCITLQHRFEMVRPLTKLQRSVITAEFKTLVELGKLQAV